MTDITHTRNTKRGFGNDAAIPIDFAISHEGSLVIFVPITAMAEELALEVFSASMVWGAGFVCKLRDAGDIVEDLFCEGCRLSLDGREIVPAWRQC